MTLRLVVAAFLLLVAVGLPLAAMSDHGVPWGFRGHVAAVLDAVGDVEATASEGRRSRLRGGDGALVVAPNLRLDDGDQVRVARLGQARLRFRNADVVAGDGAHLRVVDGGVLLKRGLLRVQLPPRAQQSFAVALEGGVRVAVRGGDVPAVATFLVDGAGAARARVTDGSLDVRSGDKDLLVEAERVFTLDGVAMDAVDLPPPPLVTAVCTLGSLQVTAPAVTQVFAAGALAYPRAPRGVAMFELAGRGGGIPIIVRDVAGRATRVVATCGAKT